MKKLIIILIIALAGLNCQAQTNDKLIAEHLSMLIKIQSAIVGVLENMTDRIDRLELKIKILENKVKILSEEHLQDSIKLNDDRMYGNEVIQQHPDTILINSEMDFFNGTVPVIMKRNFR